MYVMFTSAAAETLAAAARAKRVICLFMAYPMISCDQCWRGSVGAAAAAQAQGGQGGCHEGESGRLGQVSSITGQQTFVTVSALVVDADA
eukprot:m.922487 g.922487  ORF g.922487 m.922487 type:complete len:90 (-) comp99222_c0_seq1:53-322(-)